MGAFCMFPFFFSFFFFLYFYKYSCVYQTNGYLQTLWGFFLLFFSLKTTSAAEEWAEVLDHTS